MIVLAPRAALPPFSLTEWECDPPDRLVFVNPRATIDHLLRLRRAVETTNRDWFHHFPPGWLAFLGYHSQQIEETRQRRPLYLIHSVLQVTLGLHPAWIAPVRFGELPFGSPVSPETRLEARSRA